MVAAAPSAATPSGNNNSSVIADLVAAFLQRPASAAIQAHQAATLQQQQVQQQQVLEQQVLEQQVQQQQVLEQQVQQQQVLEHPRHAIAAASAAARERLSAARLTIDDMRKVFHLSSAHAAHALGISINHLKRTCRRLNMDRWPFRKLASLKDLLQSVRDDPAIPAAQKDELEQQITEFTHRVMVNPNEKVEGILLVVRQSQYKQRHLDRKKHSSETHPASSGFALVPMGGLGPRGGGGEGPRPLSAEWWANISAAATAMGHAVALRNAATTQAATTATTQAATQAATTAATQAATTAATPVANVNTLDQALRIVQSIGTRQLQHQQPVESVVTTRPSHGTVSTTQAAAGLLPLAPVPLAPVPLAPVPFTPVPLAPVLLAPVPWAPQLPQGGPVFVMPSVTFKTINYVRLTLAAVKAMFPAARFPGGVLQHLPLTTHMRLEVDGVLRPEVHLSMQLRSTTGTNICITGLPFGAVRGMRRLGIKRLDADTLVLVLANASVQPGDPCKGIRTM
jgi:hypothetical protein